MFLTLMISLACSVKVPSRHSPGKGEGNVDLPPGFGGPVTQFSDIKSCIGTPNLVTSSRGAQCAGLSSISSAMGSDEVEGSIPPGFEAVAASLASTEHRGKGTPFICTHG